MKNQILEAAGSPRELEALYRGNPAGFMGDINKSRFRRRSGKWRLFLLCVRVTRENTSGSFQLMAAECAVCWP
jgi:hypothetical protein